MTQRYFYTDPLAASWMAKHFGMLFQTDRTQDATPDDASDHEADTAYEADCGWGKAKDRRYYIHPDSLPLLEPRVGDLVRWSVIDPRGGFFADAGAFGIFEGAGHVERVVERDGKPFFWPESE